MKSSSKKAPEVKEPPLMQVFVDRADKTYEPQEKVSGFVNMAFNFADALSFTLKAESYMDTVSVIRGNVGRGPLPESERIYFMKKDVTHKENLNPKAVIASQITAPKAARNFEFILEATQGGERLLDTYTGVDFSILYKITATAKMKSGKVINADLQFIVNCPGSGIDPMSGRSQVPQDFVISNENLETSGKMKIPAFRFEGKIYSVNCAYNEPFDGYIIKRNSEMNIKSVEIQLVRVETF